MASAQLDVHHLFRRVGFGARSDEGDAYAGWNWAELVELTLDTTRAPAVPPLPQLPPGETMGHVLVQDLIRYWLDMARRPVDQAPVVEKVTLFLSGVLTASLAKTLAPVALGDQNHLLRTLGMGDYRTLLKAVSVTPAMLLYLDNHHNVAGALNENFARELMELFTLGNGNFTQTDVTEAARAWTGHGLDDGQPRRYRFDPARHDQGPKTLFGVTGGFTGPDVVDLILDHRRADHARFMCHRLWSFFAYPVNPGGPEVTDIMATYSTSLNIRDTLRAIFLHPAFRSERARWALVRSPIEYLVAVMRHTGTDCSVLRPDWWCGGMGQNPFDPPNVNGWGQNRYWLTSSAAWSRLQMANYLHHEIASRGDLPDAAEIVSNNPRTYRHTPAQAADLALAHYQIGPVSAASRQWLVDYVTSVRASPNYWSERAGLLHLPLLLPELVMA